MDSSPVEDPCPICLKCMGVSLTTSCGHRFCRRCLAEHFYRRHFVDVGGGHFQHGGASCPYCRQLVRWCRLLLPPGAAQEAVEELQHSAHLDIMIGKVAIELLVERASGILDSIASVFNVPKSSIKLIHRGRVVRGEEQLRALAEVGARITFLSSRPPKRSMRQKAHVLCLWLLALLFPPLRLMLGLVIRALRPLHSTVWLPFWTVAVEPALHFGWAMLASLHPSFRGPPEQPAGRL